MQLSLALLLSSERMIYHGACLESVAFSIWSRAREYSYQRRKDSKSIGLSFHWRSGSLMRASNRRCCSFFPTSIQYLMSLIPASTMYFSTMGQSSKNLRCCSSVQKPITYSTPARLYQLLSKMTISPAAGKCCVYRCIYIWLFSLSEGAGIATTRNTRGLTRSVIARIVPPLPAASRPSKTTITRRPLYLIQS